MALPRSTNCLTPTPMKPPHESSTGWDTRTGRASRTPQSVCAALAECTACRAIANARRNGFASKTSAQQRKWLSSSALRPEPSALWEERRTTPASNAESSRPKDGGTACTEPIAAARRSTRHGKRRRGLPNPHPSSHEQNKGHHETRDLSRGFFTRAGSTATP